MYRAEIRFRGYVRGLPLALVNWLGDEADRLPPAPTGYVWCPRTQRVMRDGETRYVLAWDAVLAYGKLT